MPSIAAHRIGSTLLSLELATRSRSLAFSVVTVERNRQQITRPYHSHATPQQFQQQATRSQSQSQQQQQRVVPRSQFRNLSSEPSRLQQLAQNTSTAGTQTPPLSSSSPRPATQPPPRSATP
ncbi:MAG: hypothetical protein Q9159_007756, partial [Coniocarpon cinnabarinum]